MPFNPIFNITTKSNGSPVEIKHVLVFLKLSISYTQTAAKLDTLMPAVLDKAFRESCERYYQLSKKEQICLNPTIELQQTF